MSRRRTHLAVLLLAIAVPACDRMPAEPPAGDAAGEQVGHVLMLLGADLDLYVAGVLGSEGARLRPALADARPVRGLEHLFEDAVATMSAADAGAPVNAMLAEYARLREAAEEALRGPRRQGAYEALRAVREEQIGVVLGVFGEAAVHDMLAEARSLAQEMESALGGADEVRDDSPRTHRMLATARNMIRRAGRHLEQGHAATALDLGSHGVGLLNAVRATLGPR